MKRLLVIIPLLVIFLLLAKIPAYAYMPPTVTPPGGGCSNPLGCCTCIGDQFSRCNYGAINCVPGLGQPQCAPISSCNGSANSCTCVPIPGVCGTENNVCCQIGPTHFTDCDPGLQCYNGICLRPTPAPVPTSSGGNNAGGIANVCEFIKDSSRADCISCFTDENNPGSWTAIGCIRTNPTDFVSKLLTFGINIAGGIAFLLILLGGFQMMTSAGNPEQLNAGRELVSAAITGLILIIFSVFLLRLIGVSILGIPGWE